MAPQRGPKKESEAKLVLLFLILVIGSYTVIIQHRLFLPVDQQQRGASRKHLLNKEAAQQEFVGNSTPAASTQTSAGAAERSGHNYSLKFPLLGGKGDAAGSTKGVGRSTSKSAGNGSASFLSRPNLGRLLSTDYHAPGSNQQPDLAKRRQEVEQAMRESWGAYVQYAWGKDELDPVHQVGRDSLGGLGATIVDALDTLWLMGMKPEFNKGRDWVAANLSFSQEIDVSLFETNIRIGGGLLAAYDLSGERIFLDKASELGGYMLATYTAGPAGLPNNDLRLGPPASKINRPMVPPSDTVGLAEFGSVQVEFAALSARTGNRSYANAADAVIHLLHKNYLHQGLLPMWFNRWSGQYNSGNTYSMGGMADSYFEYLLKAWLLGGKKDEERRAMWEAAMDEAAQRLVQRSTPDNLTYVAHVNVASTNTTGRVEHVMEHLACFLPGNLAQGVDQGAVTGAKAAQYLELARKLTYTCWQMYQRTPTGLSPEEVIFDPKTGLEVGQPPINILRPETLESLWILHRVTGDAQYRDWGWTIFQAFQKNCHTSSGYAGILDVTETTLEHDNTQQSFWLAETLKYLWLLLGPGDDLPFGEWVLNTEAHPLRIMHPSR